jgi:hypothetical protein
VKTFDELAPQDRARVTKFAEKISHDPAEQWYAQCSAILDGPGAPLELNDLFWAELFREAKHLQSAGEHGVDIRASSNGLLSGADENTARFVDLNAAAVIAGVNLQDILDADLE